MLARSVAAGRLAIVLIAVGCWVGVASSQAAGAPVNTAPPTVSGTATQGDTLTENNGTWDSDPTPALTYQWEDCDSSGAACNPITGATDQSYLLTANDVGHTVVVQETDTNTTGPTTVGSNATPVVTAPPLPAPANTAPPTISGTTTQGQTLTETNGTWNNNPVPPFTYQWEDCDSSGAACAAISGAINQTYLLTANDVGHEIVVQETATNATGPTVASSAATAVVAPPLVVALAPASTAPPTISGTTTQGQTLTETNGAWANNPTTVTNQWEDCNSTGTGCSPISGATGATYILAAGDVGHAIVLSETATNTVGSTVANSNTTAVVAAAPVAPANSTPPTISGTATQGQTLTETDGTWANNPVTVTNKWEDCNSAGAACTAIPGATGPTYILAAGDVGHAIVLSETATNAVGSTVANSNTTAVVAAPPLLAPVNTAPPTISGTTTQGQTLTETNGTWSNTPTTVTNQWEDCNSTGTGCVAIPGAINQTYLLTAADVGQTIEVQETATNATGPAVVSSAATAVVAAPIVVSVALTNTAPPTISGTAIQGQTLTETDGTWNNTPTTVTNQWEDCNSAGTGCTAIPGAALGTYVLTAGDVGHSVVVRETVANAAGPAAASSAPTAVVAAPDPSVVSSSTALTVVPSRAVTNQDVILGATVTSAATPRGTITFNDDGAPISGCARLPVNSQPTIVTCETSFSASTSPEQLTAVFAPTAPSGSPSAAGSTSSAQQLAVGRDSTATALSAPGASVRVGARTTYTASVTPSDVGSLHASGSVEFLDRGTPIAACASRPLITSNGASTATCTVSYKTTGKHVITAGYAGDGNFSGSTAQPVSLGTAPARILGTIISTMQWTFHYTPSYTTVMALIVNGAPVGATVLVQCHGGGCPFAKHANAVGKRRPVNLMVSFHGRRLHAGTQITVELSRPHWIGKDYRFTMRARRAPRIQIDCLAPGGTRPGVGC